MKSGLLGIALVLISSLVMLDTVCRAEEDNDTLTGAINITPGVSGITVDGDDNKFREDWWTGDGLKGGLDEFTLHRQTGNGTTLEAQGRAIVPEEDYRLGLRVSKKDVGYVRAGYREYRKYFDDTGGFFQNFSGSSYDLDKDLHLDIGRVFIEAALTLPRKPKLVVGYEHRFKDGEKSLLEWGSVTEGGVTRKIFPSFKEIDEKLDVIRLEVSHDIANVRVGDEFRYEHYSIDTKRHEQESSAGASETVTVDEDYRHDAFFNTFHAETHLNDKTFLSLGYLFTTLDGEASFRMVTVPFGPESFDKNWFSNAIDLSQDTHIVNFNAVFGPYRDVTIYAGLEGERLDREGDTDAILTEIGFTGTESSPEALIDSDEDRWGIEETLGIRYTGLPRTTLYAEGRWTQQDIDLSETELEDAVLELDRDTDTRVRRQRYSIGFNSSPWARTMVAARYRRSYRSNDYDHRVDNVEGNDPNNVYSAFITDQDIKTDEVMIKLSFRPLPRIRTGLQYQFKTMDIDTDEDTDPPSSKHSCNYDAHIYTASITATPVARLFLTGLASYQDVRLKTLDGNTGAIISYVGDVLSLAANAGWAIDSRTSLDIQYVYSLTENFEDISSDGLPLGVENQRHAVLADLTRQLTDNLSVKLRYGFYSYDDETSDGSDNYTAHLIGATCSMTF
jgi:hypothetical protein